MRTTFLSFFVTCLTLASGCSEDAQNLGGLSGAAGSGQATGGTSGGQAQGTGGTGQAAGGFSQGTGGTESGGHAQATGGSESGGHGPATGGSDAAGGFSQGTGGTESGGTGQATGGFSQGTGGTESGGTGQATGGTASGGFSQGAGGTASGGTGQAGGAGGATQEGGHAVRFAFQSGQETVGDFCVLYKDTADSTWAATKLLESNGLKAADFDGMKRMTRYLPLAAAPEAFGFVYPGQPCSQAKGWGFTADQLPLGFTHYTVIAIPYSNEAITVWAVGDRVEDHEGPGTIAATGVRAVNASSFVEVIDVRFTASNGEVEKLDQIPFGNSPAAYTVFPGSPQKGPGDHLALTEVTDSQGASTLDWAGALDLLPISPPRTIYLTGTSNDLHALACEDTSRTQDGDPSSAHCFQVSVP